MFGASFNVERTGRKLALIFVALALFLRVMIPAGFMPTTGKGLAITLCTSMSSTPAWIDEHGQVHKGKSSQGEQVQHPCVFAGFGATLDIPSIAGLLIPSVTATTILIGASATSVTIGRGLAAPPPPSTGPPSAD